MKGFLSQRSIQIFLAIVLYLGLSPILPQEAHQGLYAISLLMKDLLLWILPLSVGFFIAHAVFSFEKQAPLFILTLFIFEWLSNSLCVWYTFGCGHLAIHSLSTMSGGEIVDNFTPLWRFAFSKPAWWTADKGSFVGLAVGLIAAFAFPKLRIFLTQGKMVAEKILTNFFSRLISLFILGFVAKMHQTDLLRQMSVQYADFILWLVVFLIAYIALLFFLGSGFSKAVFFKSIKNLTPAAGIAFSSGCSLSSMPWTIEGASKNLQNPDLAKAVIPATTNIQQVGDCIMQTFLCFLIYFHFYGHAPSLAVWIPFSLVFVLARFATAAVLGGAIFLMLPIYESYLQFTPEMIAIILAFNVILDPLVTCSNVIANGALCRIFEKVWLVVKDPKQLRLRKNR